MTRPTLCFMAKVMPLLSVVKLLQNNKGQKILGYPTKKQSFSMENCFFVGSGIPNFVGPSYFEVALVVIGPLSTWGVTRLGVTVEIDCSILKTRGSSSS